MALGRVRRAAALDDHADADDHLLDRALRRAGRRDRPRPGLARGRRPAPGHDRGARGGAAALRERGRDLRPRARPADPAQQARERLPILQVEDVLAAAWLPGDGYLDPELLALALADGARRGGVEIHEHTRVTGLVLQHGRIAGVETDRGTIATEVVVDAAGAAAGVVAAMAGAVVPIVPMRHQYVVTAPLDPALPDTTTTVRDPDGIHYFRPEQGGLLVGGYSRHPVTWDTDAPLAQARTLFDPDPESFAESWERAQDRVPDLRDREIVKTVNGPEAFTPDGEFCLGETEVPGLWVAAGFCVHGLAGAGGVGKVMAEWIAEGLPEYDMAGMDVRRFGGHYRSRRHARVRALDAYSRYYDVVYPRRGVRGRAAGARLARLRAAGASSTRAGARRPAGSGPTGSSRMPPTATRRCARAAGPGGSGRRRSAPSASPRGTARPCSTSPPSPSST